MINEPSVDLLLEELGTKEQPASRYELCVVAAKRARQIMERNDAANNPENLKEITLACEEIADGKVKSVKD